MKPGCKDAQPQRAALICGEIAGEGAHQHHAFETHIVNASALGDEFANCGEQEWGGDADGGRRHADQD
nr:hypothetical protein [Mesorhizobium sp.]